MIGCFWQGVQHVKLSGRLSVLLCPLTNIIPLVGTLCPGLILIDADANVRWLLFFFAQIGAAQVAFINPPSLKLDFTDAANIADCALIEKAVRKVILSIINSMAVLPNRFLVKLDPAADYFKVYQPYQGILRLTVEKATGVTGSKKSSGIRRFMDSIAKDVPDCYAKVTLGAESEWRTSSEKNSHEPTWNETSDVLVSDYDQTITVDVQDEDVVGDDDMGIASITVKQLLLAGGSQELKLTHDGQITTGSVTIHAKFYKFVPDAASFSSDDNIHQGTRLFCGLATVLVASVLGLSGQRDELRPSVKVSWGTTKFRTAAKAYAPGVDIFNPSFDTAFRIPITRDMVNQPEDFVITLMNGDAESGCVVIPFADVLRMPGMVLEDSFDVGSGVSVRASISLRGMQLAE